MPLPFSKAVQQFLKKYVELDTSRPDGKYYPAAIDLIDQTLTTIGFACEQVKIPKQIAEGPNRVHLVARRNFSKELPTLVIYNHIDVVPAHYDKAFVFSSDTKKIYGRGTCDHKGSTAAVISALEQLKKEHLRFNLVFLATTDEETNQREQLQFLASKLKLPKNTLIFDPDTFAGGVTIAHLGCLQLDLTIHGKSSHSAASHLGENAVEHTRLLLDFFAKEKKRQEKQLSKITPFPGSHVKSICSRCNVNMISGGIASNVVPDLCHLTVDYRFIPEKDVRDEKMKIIENIEQFCHTHELRVKVEIKTEYEGYASDHEEATRLNKVYKKYSKDSGKYAVMGSTPAAHWSKELQIPHFGIGVARWETNMHSNHEFAYIKDLVSLEKTLIEYLK